MKKTAILLLALTLIFSLASCSQKTPSATDLLFDALNTLECVPPYDIFYGEAPKHSGSYMTSENAYLLYKDCDMTSYAESFACALGKDDSVWEIHIFVALSVGDAGFIENALEKRLDILRNKEIYVYDNDAYESRISDAKVFRNGKTVCLTVCDDNAKVIKAIKG
jgi:hypothetical protein